MNYFAHGVLYDVRTDSFGKMQRLDMAFFDEKETGERTSLPAASHRGANG